MKKTNHTSGPWKLETEKYMKTGRQKHYTRVTIKSEENQVITKWDDIRDIDTMANAHLIRSAPELYDIGQRAYRAMSTGKITDELLTELDNILNKAEGRI